MLQAEPQPLSLLPLPAKVTRRVGDFSVRNGLAVIYDQPAARDEASQMVGDFAKWGRKLSLQPRNAKASDSIRFTIVSNLGVGREGYRMRIGPTGAQLSAETPTGLFYARQTLRQMIATSGDTVNLPFVDITDSPRFPWRGMHLDVSRHFFPVDKVKGFIDLIASYKMNVFHWHLVDDGGWRIEIKKYPELTRRGAFRSQPVKGSWDYNRITFPPQKNGTEYGGFYTQQQIREVVAYAAKRHVTIIPEIEMPGHTTPSITAYPNLGCEWTLASKPPGPGVNVYCAGKEEAFQFLEDVLKETLALFPSKFIHVGGDEVDKTFWKQCPKCQARMKSLGLNDEHELQSYFIGRMSTWLSDNGRRLMGWDEILEGGLAPGASVMSWRGIEGGIAAVQQGRNAVMSPTSHCYFDYPYSSISTEHVYGFDPIPKGLTPSQENLILGGQGNLWSEWLPEWSDVERMAFPRALALSEVVWSPKAGRSWKEFSPRLEAQMVRLDSLGVNSMLPEPNVATGLRMSATPESIRLDPSKRKGLLLRYSTTGVDPTKESPVYDGPIIVQPDSEVRMAYFSPDGNRGPIARSLLVKPLTSIREDWMTPGLQTKVYQGTWDKLPDFEKLKPVSESRSTVIGTRLRPSEENYGLTFTGFLRIPREGRYRFSLGSDDGSRLKLNGLIAIDHDGPHGFNLKVLEADLKPGFLAIRVEFFEIGGADKLELLMSGPGLAEGPIPSDLLSHYAEG